MNYFHLCIIECAIDKQLLRIMFIGSNIQPNRIIPIVWFENNECQKLYRSIIIIICKGGILFSIRSNKRMPVFMHSLAEQIFGLFTPIHPWVCCARLELSASLARIMITGFLTYFDILLIWYLFAILHAIWHWKTRTNVSTCKHRQKITICLTSA